MFLAPAAAVNVAIRIKVWEIQMGWEFAIPTPRTGAAFHYLKSYLPIIAYLTVLIALPAEVTI